MNRTRASLARASALSSFAARAISSWPPPWSPIIATTLKPAVSALWPMPRLGVANIDDCRAFAAGDGIAYFRPSEVFNEDRGRLGISRPCEEQHSEEPGQHSHRRTPLVQRSDILYWAWRRSRHRRYDIAVQRLMFAW